MQGCTLKCQGCTNAHLWSRDGAQAIEESVLFDIIIASNVDGICLHGGEPMEQSDELAKLVKKLIKSNKSIITFTGYELDELKTQSQQYILKNSDIIISGRYDKTKRNAFLQFRGSTNQTVTLNNPKYKDYKLTDGKTVCLLSFNETSVEIKGFLEKGLLPPLHQE